MKQNKLIAEFMGMIIKQGACSGVYANNKRICGLDGLKYNLSWDWLMPVITGILGIASELDEMERYHIVIDQIPQISHTYKSVVEFINWYNKEEKEK